MNVRRTGVTFDAEALWAKSKAFIERALKARDRQDDVEFHLWSALSLELIGKSALATVSPALVADPQDFKSLLFACGGKEPVDKKSIQAKTVFERLTQINQNFDEKMKEQCNAIASRRNAELHSGESPMVGLDPRAWVRVFWSCATAIIKGQGRTVEEWVGGIEAQRVSEILADASRILNTIVRARLERMKKEYDARLPPGSPERNDAHSRAAARSAPQRLAMEADELDEHDCPACTSKGWLLGYSIREEVDGPHHEQDGDGLFFAYEIVKTHYSVDGFRCVECGLSLAGRAELDIVQLPEEFLREETREPEYEQDYGND